MLAGQKQTDFLGTLRTCSPILVAKTPFFLRLRRRKQTVFLSQKKIFQRLTGALPALFQSFLKVSTLVWWKAVTFSVVGTSCVLIIFQCLMIIFFPLLTLLFAVKSRVRLHQDDFQSSKNASLRIHAQVSRGYWHPLYLTITRKNCHF